MPACKKRYDEGKHYSIVALAEATRIKGLDEDLERLEKDSFGNYKYPERQHWAAAAAPLRKNGAGNPGISCWGIYRDPARLPCLTGCWGHVWV